MLSWEVRKNSLGTRKDDVLDIFMLLSAYQFAPNNIFFSQCIGFFSPSNGSSWPREARLGNSGGWEKLS